MFVGVPITWGSTLLLALPLMEEIPISASLQAASGKGKSQPDNRNGSERYNDSHDNK